MKKITFSILFLIIFYSCSKSQEISGIYKSDKTTIFEKLEYNTNRNIKNLELTLNKDSLFFYNTCGLLLEGSWFIKNDSLLLSVTKAKWKNDSLNRIGKEIKEPRKEFLTYKIEKNKLIGFIDKGDYQIVNKLIKK